MWRGLVRAGEGFEDRWLVVAGRKDANVSESDDAAASSVGVGRDPGEQRVSVGDEHPVIGDRVGVDRMKGPVDTGEIGRAGELVDAESDDVWVLRSAGVGAGVDAA